MGKYPAHLRCLCCSVLYPLHDLDWCPAQWGHDVMVWLIFHINSTVLGTSFTGEIGSYDARIICRTLRLVLMMFAIQITCSGTFCLEWIHVAGMFENSFEQALPVLNFTSVKGVSLGPEGITNHDEEWETESSSREGLLTGIQKILWQPDTFALWHF